MKLNYKFYSVIATTSVVFFLVSTFGEFFGFSTIFSRISLVFLLGSVYLGLKEKKKEEKVTKQ